MNHESLRRAIEQHNWRRTAIDVLAAIGAVMLYAHNDDIQQWIRNRNAAPTVTTTPAGLPAETILIIDDQVRTALRTGGQESFADGTLICTNGVEVRNPIDIVLPTGQRVAVARVQGTSGSNLDVMVINANAPDSPYTYGTVRCAFIPSGDEQASGLHYGQVYNFYFTNGDPNQPINQDTGKPFVDESGRPIAIGAASSFSNP